MEALPPVTAVTRRPLPPLPLSARRGHEVFAAAAASLTNNARDGIRAGYQSRDGSYSARNGVSLNLGERPSSRRGSLSSRVHRSEGGSPASFAGVGPLTIPHHGNSIRGPLGQDAREMHAVCEQIGKKAAQKFRTMREAFRYVDADRDGLIDRSEVRYFFRAYDYPETVADRFFDRLDLFGSGHIDFQEFVQSFSPAIESGKPPDAKLASEGSTREPSRASTPQEVATDKQSFEREFLAELGMIKEKAPQRFSHAREFARYLDADGDGYISPEELGHLCRALNLSEPSANRLVQWFDRGSGLDYQDVMKHLGPHLDLPGISAVMQSSSKGGTEARNSSRRSSGFSSSAWPERTLSPDSGFSQELHGLMRDIGAKLPLKFRHVRDAFRPLDLSKTGKITRSEMRSFLRGFDWSEDVADRLFFLLSEEGGGKVNYNHFMAHFDDILGPASRAVQRHDLLSVENGDIEREVHEIAGLLGERLNTKFKNLREAFRPLDLHKTGQITKSELRAFFRTMVMPADAADKVFESLRRPGLTTILTEDFMALFGPPGGLASMETLQDMRRPTISRFF
mmetsp:Transcript_42420/g.76168  ORF Transcript_42420/g.76168 Transcript_42420/m.76168 type:complete len:568 (+) Transcript_42420:37-1740(+)|eukprot:CAMPEP_0197634284 /NCGR_PEP_ID=MMETSP1338-20131121/10419_1 /TAXON_ID=43686 ORGANISM="Pelagodinium beii, Strain RCC1491" /NCGR_SAMPLE_ID=MMETSP1338 /ASSEMBLY_ACC=CAM_ASM_000754 /LENGTH=567 /DNA_ID=CAMNT_0043206121 /DNA_START=37 /DNA_END=1740 /DNA_ORIENTATION=-